MWLSRFIWFLLGMVTGATASIIGVALFVVIPTDEQMEKEYREFKKRRKDDFR